MVIPPPFVIFYSENYTYNLMYTIFLIGKKTNKKTFFSKSVYFKSRMTKKGNTILEKKVFYSLRPRRDSNPRPTP